jgi:hypothetical protein
MVAPMTTAAFRCPICNCTSFERIASPTQHRRAVYACCRCSVLFSIQTDSRTEARHLDQ